jgi:hypothetical protein
MPRHTLAEIVNNQLDNARVIKRMFDNHPVLSLKYNHWSVATPDGLLDQTIYFNNGIDLITYVIYEDGRPVIYEGVYDIVHARLEIAAAVSIFASQYPPD